MCVREMERECEREGARGSERAWCRLLVSLKLVRPPTTLGTLTNPENHNASPLLLLGWEAFLRVGHVSGGQPEAAIHCAISPRCR